MLSNRRHDFFIGFGLTVGQDLERGQKKATPGGESAGFVHHDGASRLELNNGCSLVEAGALGAQRALGAKCGLHDGQGSEALVAVRDHLGDGVAEGVFGVIGRQALQGGTELFRGEVGHASRQSRLGWATTSLYH